VGIDVSAMYLCYIPPGDDPAKLYKAFDLRDELRVYFGKNDIFDI
jgi:hypothetical protein